MTDWICSPELMARIRAAITPVETDTPLSKVLMEDFPEDCSNLPISGGWGYSQLDAIIFVKSKFPPDIPRHFTLLEYHIVEKIAYEELIIFKPKGHQYSGIKVDPTEQALLREGGRVFDRIDVRISCWSDQHWEWLKRDWEHNRQSDHFDFEAHSAKREASKIEYARQFWFDITSVFHSTYQS